MLDMLYQGQAYGDVASRLLQYNFDINCLRPFVAPEDGQTYLCVNTGRRNKQGQVIIEPRMIQNAPATLRRDDWLLVDETVKEVYVPRMQAVGDLRSRGLEYNIPNGMGHTHLGYEVMGDVTPATISMDGVRISEFDRPQFDFRTIPLPIIHKDFQFTARQIQVSRQGGTPLDLAPVRRATRRVAEEAEKLTIGASPSYTYQGGTIYGYANFPQRITKTDITPPTDVAWEGSTLVNEILAMRQLAFDKFMYGPFVIYMSPAWAQYLDVDYSDTKGENTVRSRVLALQGIEDIRVLEYLTGFQILMVMMSAENVQMVIGMEVTTVRWEQQGGMQVNFKVMAIMVPRLMADYNSSAPIIHGTTS
jgi:uncharacterized linocin/CFP29 family protein